MVSKTAKMVIEPTNMVVFHDEFILANVG